jgi:hypothetical protein
VKLLETMMAMLSGSTKLGSLLGLLIGMLSENHSVKL